MSLCGCDDNTNSTDTLIPIDEALKLLLSSAKTPQDTECVGLTDALGRVLAKNLSSTINVPGTDNSAMDGYAIRCEDLIDNQEIRLPISQRICAGQMGSQLQPGTAARIFTGAPIPPGANAVVMQEVCTQKNDDVLISGPIELTKNIRRAGEDIMLGDNILQAGHKLKPQDLGLIASVGIATIEVTRRIRVAVFFTGDELRTPGTALEPGQIYDSNRYTLTGLLKSLGCEVIDLGIVADTLKATKDAMIHAAKVSDFIMTSGGVSVGEEDYVREALTELGQLDMWRINIKPGKPLAFGKVLNTPFMGLPGNPVAVFTAFSLFARPYILRTQGSSYTSIKSFQIPANFDLKKSGTRCEYIRANAEFDDNGKMSLSIYHNQGSGVLRSASWANGLALIQPNTVVSKGDLIEFIPFSELSI